MPYRWNVNDDYCNAVVGKLVEVASRSWGNLESRMAVIVTDDPFAPVTVRVWVRNYSDAEILVDRTVVFYEGRVYPLG